MNLLSSSKLCIRIAALLVLALSVKHADAALVFSMTDVTIAAGGSGTIDVILTNNSSPTIDPIDGFITLAAPVSLDFVEFNAIITPIAGAGDLIFSISDPMVAYDTSFQSDPTYLFQDDGLPFASATQLSLQGEDEVNSISGDSITIGSFDMGGGFIPESRLVARISVDHVLGSGQTTASFPDTTFTVSLNEGATGVFDFNDLDNDEKAFTIATGGGMVSVVAVPEPSSLLMLGMVGAGYWRLRDRRGNRQKQV